PGEGGLLLGRRLFLIFRAPLRGRHAVDARAGLVLVQRDALVRRGVLVPIAEAVAAEAAMDHEIDVLNIRALTKMLDQAGERRRLQLDLQLGINRGHESAPIIRASRSAQAAMPASSLKRSCRISISA